VRALETADICGVDWTYSPSTGLPFYAGNFFWGRASYIRTCKLSHNNRFDCENFIGTGKGPRVKTFHQSGENPKLMVKYSYEKYPKYYHAPPTAPYFQKIMNLGIFEYLDEYYR
jgi:hypothetical protein